MRIKASRAKSGRIIGAIVTLGVLLLSGTFLMVRSSSAEEVSWQTGEPVLLEEVTYRPPSQGIYESVRNCAPQSVWVAGQVLPQEKCIVTNEVISIDSRFEYIKVGSDQQYYALRGMGTGLRPTHFYAPGSDKYIMRNGFGPAGHSGYLEIDANLLESLTSNTNSVGLREYNYNYTPTPDFVLKDSNGRLAIGKGGAVSKNGRWLVVELFGKGFARIDLQNEYKTELFSNLGFSYDSGIYLWAEMAVSDDGRYVAISDRWVPPLVFEINNDCLRSVSPDEPLSLEGYQSCPFTSLGDVMRSVENYQYPGGLDFGENGLELLIQTAYLGSPCGSGLTNCSIWRTVRAAGYMPTTSRLDYLALGDSYSSGEGDTERSKITGRKYYRDYTDNEEDRSTNQPREKCHISTRSYPYILSQGMSLGDPTNSLSTKWQTVACSGATTWDVEGGDSYAGQGKGKDWLLDDGSVPRLKDYDAESLQAIALNEFIPGREGQVEFVKKYKPKVITLTMGGNNVGFADKLTSCAIPSVSHPTCHIATVDGKPQLSKEISDQYDSLKSLYEKLYDASDKTAKIYVLGYPQFINGNMDVSCRANIGSLNIDERRAINASVTYLNSVIKQAAKAVGVKYIDIEDSLQGGQLCDENQAYMTGISMIGSNEIQESFHPNAKGNYQIAMKVWEEVSHESLLDYDICPESDENKCPDTSATKDTIPIPPYFQIEEPAYVIEYAGDMTSRTGIKGSPIHVVRTSYSFSPDSTVEVTLFSDPIDLGRYSVGHDGSLDIPVQIPDSVPAGYHTLTVDGVTYSGEPIRYEQIILVKGIDSNDIDENGTPDEQQLCGPFMETSNTDVDLDGIDDACDPQIAEKPELYRGRLGDEKHIYIERNTHASSITGVSGDYDPDNDGWVVVGVGEESQLAGVDIEAAGAVDFELLGNGTTDSPYDPVLYVYSADQKCTAYRPASLSVVKANESRGLVRARISNDKCYQDLSEGNTDGDSDGDGEHNSPSSVNDLIMQLRNILQKLSSLIHTVLNTIMSKVQSFVLFFRR